MLQSPLLSFVPLPPSLHGAASVSEQAIQLRVPMSPCSCIAHFWQSQTEPFRLQAQSGGRKP